MFGRPLRRALTNWPRNVTAVAVVAVAFGAASLLATGVAYYGAWLIAFSVWMVWFVLVAVDWIGHADF